MITATETAWQTATLGECCDIVSGSTPRRDTPEYWGGDIPWVTPKDLSDLSGPIFNEPVEFITESGFKSCSTQMLPKGALLFSSRAPIGLVAIAGLPLCTNQGFKSLVPRNDVDSRYLYYCMKRLVPRIQELGNGATFKEVSRAVMEKVEIPLPPLPEQKRIADILDKADALRRKRQEAVDHVESMRRSVFLDIFGDPTSNPCGWQPVVFDKLLSDGMRNGISPSRRGTYTGKVLILSAITGGNFDPSAVKEGTFDSPFDEGQLVDNRMFLICRGNGNKALVGAGHFPTQSLSDTVFPDTMIGAAVDSEKVESSFLEEIWSTRHVRAQIESGARTTNGTHKVNQKVLSRIEFPLPPMAKQEQFGRIIRKLEDLQCEFDSQQSNDLFNSLVQRAFRGEL